MKHDGYRYSRFIDCCGYFFVVLLIWGFVMTKDNLVFYTSVLAACVVFLLWGSESRACTTDVNLLVKMEKALTKKIYAIRLNMDNSDFTDSGVQSMWELSARQAHSIIVDNYACKDFVYFEINLKK